MRKEIRIGLFGLITLAGFIWSYKFLQGSNLFSQDKIFYAKFDDVSNIDVSSIVQINGYKVGNVVDLALDPTNVDKIKVTFTVKNEINLPKNAIAAIKTGSVMGEKSIELLFKDICVDNCATSGDELAGGEIGLMASMLPEKDLDVYLSKLRESASGIMDDMKSDTSSNTFMRTVENLEETSLRLVMMVDKVNRMLDKSSKNIDATLTNTASVTGNLSNNNAKITQILTNLEVTLSKINGKIDNTFEGADNSMANLSTSLETANKSFNELNTMLADINTGEGLVNKLIHDKKMAEDLKFSLDNIGLLLQDVRLNPKRYIDVSVFGKKQKNYNLPESDPAFDN